MGVHDSVIDKDLAAAYTRAFATGDGEKVLEDLFKRYNMLDSSAPEFLEGQALDPNAVMFREGQRSVVLFILSMMEGTRLGLFNQTTTRTMNRSAKG